MILGPGQVMRLPFVAICFLLAGCTDADWDNALSFLPMERGSQSPGAHAEQQDATAAPVAVEGAQPIGMDTPVAEAAPATAANQPRDVAQTDEAHCREVATQRASDGAAMGMDDDEQKQEFQLTYANCVAWDKAHAYGR